MSYYKKNYYKNKKKKPIKKSTNKGVKNIGLTILIVLLCFGIIGAVLKLFDVPSWNNKNDEVKSEHVEVFLVPSQTWAADKSSYGAWAWNDKGVPEGTFVLATDEDGDGVFTVNVHKDYNRMLFVDLVPDATELGEDWKNKREQSSNLAVPVDENVYYHQYANEWTNSKEILFEVIAEDVYVYLNVFDWANLNSPVMYCFDKTGAKESTFISMTQCGSNQYLATVPAGYTHIVFLEYNEEGVIGEWDNVLNQTSDLIIPTGEANHYYTDTNEWKVPTAE